MNWYEERHCGCQMEFWVQDPWNEIDGAAEGGLKKIRTCDLKILALYDHIYRNRKWFDEQRRAEKNLRSA